MKYMYICKKRSVLEKACVAKDLDMKKKLYNSEILAEKNL